MSRYFIPDNYYREKFTEYVNDYRETLKLPRLPYDDSFEEYGNNHCERMAWYYYYDEKPEFKHSDDGSYIHHRSDLKERYNEKLTHPWVDVWENVGKKHDYFDQSPDELIYKDVSLYINSEPHRLNLVSPCNTHQSLGLYSMPSKDGNYNIYFTAHYMLIDGSRGYGHPLDVAQGEIQYGSVRGQEGIIQKIFRLIA